MKAPRILVLSASVGAGHLRAAQAVELALKKLAPRAEIVGKDVLELSTPAFRRIYGAGYLDLVNAAPHVLGYFYDLLDRPRSESGKGDRMRIAFEKLSLRPFLKLLTEERWDAAVNTHFLPAEIIASLRGRGELDLPQFTVTTDFATHRLWVHPHTEGYFTATEEGAQNLAAWGVESSSIRAVGIPIHPVFSAAKDRAACLLSQGLSDGPPVVLQLAGGFGVGPIEKLYAALASMETPVQLVAVCGRNAELKTRVEKIPVPKRHRAKVIGFTDKIDELMRAADVVLTKPGGLTTSEVLACGAVMAIVNPIPGQESQNSDYLLENGAAVKITNAATAAPKLSALLADAKRLRSLKQNARRLARPSAALDVARSVLEYVEKKG